MKINQHGKAISATILLAVIVSAAGAFMLWPKVEAQEPWARDTKLDVDATYILTGDDDNIYDNIVPAIVSIYLTNEQWALSGNVRIVAYLFQTNPDLAVGKSTVEINAIPGSVTEEIEIPITIPGLDTSYDIRFLVFEDDLLVLQGNGSVEVYRIIVGNHEYRQGVNSQVDFNKVY